MRGRPSVIPAGQDDLLRRMLDPPEGLPDGWQLESAELGRDGARARYRRDGERVELALVQRERARTGALRTESFAIEDAESLPEELARAIEISVLAREHRVRFAAAEPSAPLEPALIALDAGVVPALRLVTTPEQVLATEQRFLAHGAVVARLQTGDQSILFVAPHASDAERARDLERRLTHAELGLGERRTLLEELGWALGFPTCCVAAHAVRSEPGVFGVVGSLVSGRIGNRRYRAARDAWVSQPDPRLNAFLRPIRRSLIAFDPCRYDCALAIDHASRVAAACRELDPTWLADNERRLAEPIVVSPTGPISIVHVERRIEPMRIVGARPLRSSERVPSDEELALAAQLVGAETREDGFLTGAGTAWCLLVDFGASATPGSAGAARR